MKIPIIAITRCFITVLLVTSCLRAFAAIEVPDQKPVLLFAQIRTLEPVNQVTVQYVENPMNVLIGAPAPGHDFIEPEIGSLIDGTYGSRTFSWSADSAHPGRISLSIGYKKLIDDFLVFPGDSIQLMFDEYSGQLVFNGPAADHFNLQYRLQRLQSEIYFSNPVNISSYNIESMFRNGNTYEQFLLDQNNRFGRKVNINKIDPPIMLENLISKIQDQKDLDPFIRLLDQDTKVDESIKLSIRNKFLDSRFTVYAKNLGSLLGYSVKLNDGESLNKILVYIQDVLIPDLLREGELLGNGNFHPFLSTISELVKISAPYTHLGDQKAMILQNFEGDIKDQLLASMLFLEYRRGIKTDSELREMNKSINHRASLELTEELLGKTEKGKQVRYFEFIDENGKRTDIKDLKGYYLFVYTYFDGCNASSSYFKNVVQHVAGHFGDSDKLLFVAISADRTKAIWESAIKSGNYSDHHILNLLAMDQGVYHPFFSYYNLIGFPSQMLLDPNGNIAAVSGLNRSADELTEMLEKLLEKED